MASEIYETAIEIGAEGAGILADKAVEFANSTVELVTEHIPDAIQDVRNAFNSFFENTSIAIRL